MGGDRRIRARRAAADSVGSVVECLGIFEQVIMIFAYTSSTAILTRLRNRSRIID
jgi:hypothetical protein